MKKKTSRYNGRNIYGQSCISKFVILRKETAMEQYFDALEDIEAHKGERVEYTFVLASDVPPREAEMLYQQMDKIAALRAGEQGKKFVSNATRTKSRSATWAQIQSENEALPRHGVSHAAH